jgi:hypothetical protein
MGRKTDRLVSRQADKRKADRLVSRQADRMDGRQADGKEGIQTGKQTSRWEGRQTGWNLPVPGVSQGESAEPWTTLCQRCDINNKVAIGAIHFTVRTY